MKKIADDISKEENAWIEEITNRIIPQWQQRLMKNSLFFRWLFHYGLEAATGTSPCMVLIRRLTITQWGIRRARCTFHIQIVGK